MGDVIDITHMLPEVEEGIYALCGCGCEGAKFYITKQGDILCTCCGATNTWINKELKMLEINCNIPIERNDNTMSKEKYDIGEWREKETPRALASVRKVQGFKDIPKADNIHLAIVDGWEVISKKGELELGGLCVFFEIDSLVDNSKEPFDFLKKPRIRTMKMRGVISQGLALPLHLFPEIKNPKEGLDVTKLLGIKKYTNESDPVSKEGKSTKKNAFPYFIRKTDQERVQNVNIPKLHGSYEATLKLHGQSVTYYKTHQKLNIFKKLVNWFEPNFFKEEKFGMCSRNLEVPTSQESKLKLIADRYKLSEKLPVGYAIQGELCGTGINKDYEKIKGYEFYIFDVWNIEEKRYLTPQERHLWCWSEVHIVPHIPILTEDFVVDENTSKEQLLELAEVIEPLNHGVIPEGFVLKRNTPVEHYLNSFKVINNKYLLEEE